MASRLKFFLMELSFIAFHGNYQRAIKTIVTLTNPLLFTA